MTPVDNAGIGETIHLLAQRLWPICRSLTGDGVRQTLEILKEQLPDLAVYEVPTGTQCFDWVVPREWVIRDAYIISPQGEKIVDFGQNNLHVLGYSVPVDDEFELHELDAHLYSLPAQPDAIPYITSYYEERWGFCISHNQRISLQPGRYKVVIDSRLKNGFLTYGEWILPGDTDEEVLLSTYICHPSMANNELSGPCVTAFLCKHLSSLPDRRFTYRVVFIPETIGAIAYLARNLAQIQKKTVAGYVITCVGDDRAFSFLPSRQGNSLSDIAARHVLSTLAPGYKAYSFLDRGSDERQYCSPGVDLPIASIMRTKYGEYPEYHTSLDDLTLVTSTGLQGSYAVYRRVIECLEGNCYPAVTVLCEPQLGKRGLYPTLSTRSSGGEVAAMMNLIAYSDGCLSLLEISVKIGEPMWALMPLVERLSQAGLLVRYDKPGMHPRRDGTREPVS